MECINSADLSPLEFSEDTTTTTCQPHPLLQYPIMKRLLSFTSTADLLAMRGVCQTWKFEAVPFLRDKLRIEVKSDMDFANFISTMSEVDCAYLPCSYLTLTNLNLNEIPRLGLYQQITVLSLNFCDWRSSSLRTIVFEYFPCLQSLKLEASTKSGPLLTQHILPMSIGKHKSLKPLLNLKSINLIGDFARESDVIYEILKFAPNLEGIQVEKSNQGEDDLFGTWFFEIILSQRLLRLTCLEIDSALINLQLESLLNGTRYKLKRLRLNLSQVEHPISIVRRVLKKFRDLKNVELELNQPSRRTLELISSLVQKEKFLISIHSNSSSRIVFPFDSHV